MWFEHILHTLVVVLGMLGAYYLSYKCHAKEPLISEKFPEEVVDMEEEIKPEEKEVDLI
jgi:hypothetical protein